MIYPSSGTGAWEGALVNTLSPPEIAFSCSRPDTSPTYGMISPEGLYLEVDYIPGDWRHGVDPGVVEAKLKEDTGHEIKAVAIVHNVV